MVGLMFGFEPLPVGFKAELVQLAECSHGRESTPDVVASGASRSTRQQAQEASIHRRHQHLSRRQCANSRYLLSCGEP